MAKKMPRQDDRQRDAGHNHDLVVGGTRFDEALEDVPATAEPEMSR